MYDLDPPTQTCSIAVIFAWVSNITNITGLVILLTQPFLFLLQDSLYGFPILFTVTSEHIRLFTF